MKLSLKSIRMSNFKGIREFAADLSGDEVFIVGDNETGKTSVFDGLLWLRCDRDSRGFKGAEAAKTTKGTDYEHNLEHEVEAVFEVDGNLLGSFPAREIKLKKTLREKWTKPRGKSEAIFDGNTTLYWIDDVPQQAGQFKSFMDDLIPEQLFNILCDPHYFSTELEWRDRLKMLVDMSGGISEAEVAGTDIDLQKMLERKGTRTLDDYRSLLNSQIRLLCKEIDEIPVRIAELSKSLPQSEDWQAIEHQISETEADLAALESREQNAAEAVKPILALRVKLEGLRQAKADTMAKMAAQANTDRTEKTLRLQALIRNKRSFEDQLNGISGDVERIPREIARLEADNKKLRELILMLEQNRREIQLAEFQEPKDQSNYECPTCHQSLPAEDIEIKISNMRKTYEFNRKRELDQLEGKRDRANEEGKANKAKINRLQEQLDELSLADASLTSDLIDIGQEIKTLQGDIESSANHLPSEFANDPHVIAFDGQISSIEEQLARPVEDISQQIRAEKAELRKIIDGYKSILYTRETTKKTRARIAELESTLVSKSSEKTLLEGDIFQMDQFVIERTRKLEGRINVMFDSVGFKLFKEQINGGIDECCEAVIGNTTFKKANTAGQINAGLDIINAISLHRDIHVPVFVDRRESVTNVKPVNTQVIYLQVKEGSPITVIK